MQVQEIQGLWKCEQGHICTSLFPRSRVQVVGHWL